MNRTELTKARRVVVKFGTGILTDDCNAVDARKIRRLAKEVIELRDRGVEIIIVSSGAVGAGMGALGQRKRPRKLADLQACAAVGQSRIMAMYDRYFGGAGVTTAQVLLTHEDLRHKDRHINARNTLVSLLQKGVIPIVNENDAVSFTELRFGDNDRLSALVASLIPVDCLVILTTAPGVIENFGTRGERVLPAIERIDDRIRAMAQGTRRATATGGMSTKIEAATIALRSGIPTVIASGEVKGNLPGIMSGRDIGTLILPRPKKLTGRKRWIAFFHKPKGRLLVDKGAGEALRLHGKSLLLAGIVNVQGQVKEGEVVSVVDADGREIARGIASMGGTAIRDGNVKKGEAVIHRDNLVVL